MYKNIKEIYDHERLDVFVMAVANILDIGAITLRNATDEQIEKIPEVPGMTHKFAVYLTKLSREICKACDQSEVEIIQFCMAEEIFDVNYYKPDNYRIPYNRLSEIAEMLIWGMHEEDGDWNEEFENAGIYLDADERMAFGIVRIEEDDEDDE